MVVSFLRDGTDEKKACTQTLCIIFEGSKIQSFALPYLLVLIVYIHLVFLTSQTSFEEVSSENEWLDF